MGKAGTAVLLSAIDRSARREGRHPGMEATGRTTGVILIGVPSWRSGLGGYGEVPSTPGRPERLFTQETMGKFTAGSPESCPASAPRRHVKRVGDEVAGRVVYITKMNMFRALLAPLAFLAFVGPAMADKIPLKELSGYLNKLSTAETDFTQINADGSIATGKLFIKRPGRVRFEYAPPDRSLVLASAGAVAIFDAKSNQPPEQYPLKRTPLHLILARDVDLGRAKMVVDHAEDGTSTRVRAQDPENPEYGTIDLVFTADPITLRQWVITDDLGQQTTVILGELKTGGDYPPSLFAIDAETEKRRN